MTAHSTGRDGRRDPRPGACYGRGVRAGELAVDYPTVTVETSALDAARLLAEHRLLGLIVVDDRRRPKAVLPGSQLLGALIPQYVRDDPALARAYDEGHADRLCERLAGKRVADLLPAKRTPPPVVDADATVMEIASVMAGARSPIVAVSGDPRSTDAPMIGAVTVADLLTRVLPS
ncbi:CBS domain-containing protein [Actinomadura napierensis]|uniref:CBS domain-containing protein n=1 Tax=Actinomadura napierensis TaxID=267854 RepID=A0ABP5K975_9ACTN